MSNSTEMVERVAKAMQASKAWPVVFDAGSAQELARAAIEEMKYAPYGVLDAGVCHPIKAFREEPGQGYAVLEDAHVSGQSITGLWEAMISAALSPEDEGSQSK